MSRPAVLLWVQHLLGSGHLRRALVLAEALAARGMAVTLASGGPPMPWAVPAGVELVQLPPLRSVDSAFSRIVDAAGERPLPELLEVRRGHLLELLARLRPAALLTEMFPFGRRAFRHEVLPLLEAAAELRPRPLILASVRDVLVTKERADRLQEMRDVCLAWYDKVLVHGDERLFPFGATFPHAGELGDRIVHTGFVYTAPAVTHDVPPDVVLVSAGGGAVGQRLIEAALAARPLTRLGTAPWRVVTGANLPASVWDGLQRRRSEGVVLERHRDDLAALIGRAGVIVSQAGYNTVVEGLHAAARMVLVPFDAPGQDEQQRRAARLGELGWAEVVPEASLSPPVLAAAIDRAAERRRPPSRGLSFDGAARSAELIERLIRARP
jgi:predicted glycosyltransferase